MKKMFDEYSSIALALIVTLIFLLVLGPVGNALRETIKDYVTSFTTNPEVSVFVDGSKLIYKELI